MAGDEEWEDSIAVILFFKNVALSKTDRFGQEQIGAREDFVGIGGGWGLPHGFVSVDECGREAGLWHPGEILP